MARTGRPTSFKAEFVEQAERMLAAGLTDYELAQAFGVSRQTIYLWRHQHPEFLDATKYKAVADARVERSLYERATGYTFETEKLVFEDGKPTTVKVLEHVPPSDAAMIFWLKNRKPTEWRDRREIDSGDAPIQVVVRKMEEPK